MAILTIQEAADILNYVSPGEMPPKVETVFLLAIDEYIKSATGKDWGTLTETYTVIDPVAKMAAGILLARWFEDSSELGNASGIGIVGLIAQLKAKCLQEKQATG